MRARLTTKGAGKWVESTGDRSKFGLSAVEIVEAVERLRAEDMLDCLELLHFHIGSQITAIRAHKDALREASRIFVELHALGATPRLIDVGGGLGVDYDGSQTNFHSSMNYSMQEYANDVVAPHPGGLRRARRCRTPTSSPRPAARWWRTTRCSIFDVLGVQRDAHRQAARAGRADDPKVAPGPRPRCGPTSRARTSRRPTTTRSS